MGNPRATHSIKIESPSSTAKFGGGLIISGETLRVEIKRVNLGSKGWRSSESARLPPMWPGFKSQRRRHVWTEFVVGSSRCISLGIQVFLFPEKPTFPNSISTRNQVDDELLRMCYHQTRSLFICYLLFIYGQRPGQIAAGSFRYHCKSLQFHSQR